MLMTTRSFILMRCPRRREALPKAPHQEDHGQGEADPTEDLIQVDVDRCERWATFGSQQQYRDKANSDAEKRQHDAVDQVLQDADLMNVGEEPQSHGEAAVLE